MILVIDNYDSFTYNLVQYLGVCGAEVQVARNDEIGLEEIARLRPEGILLSPGPCSPDRSGVCLDILKAVTSPHPPAALVGVPVFGVCLGMQAMGLAGGGEVGRAKSIMHGKASQIEHDGKGLFEGIPSPFQAIRYHSLAVLSDAVPPGYDVTARSKDDGEIMGIRHRTLPIEGVQFHPESIDSEHGMTMIRNFVLRCGLPSQV